MSGTRIESESSARERGEQGSKGAKEVGSGQIRCNDTYAPVKIQFPTSCRPVWGHRHRHRRRRHTQKAKRITSVKRKDLANITGPQPIADSNGCGCLLLDGLMYKPWVPKTSPNPRTVECLPVEWTATCRRGNAARGMDLCNSDSSLELRQKCHCQWSGIGPGMWLPEGGE